MSEIGLSLEKKQPSDCHLHMQLICPDCSNKRTKTHVKKTSETMSVTAEKTKVSKESIKSVRWGTIKQSKMVLDSLK